MVFPVHGFGYPQGFYMRRGGVARAPSGPWIARPVPRFMGCDFYSQPVPGYFAHYLRGSGGPRPVLHAQPPVLRILPVPFGIPSDVRMLTPSPPAPSSGQAALSPPPVAGSPVEFPAPSSPEETRGFVPIETPSLSPLPLRQSPVKRPIPHSPQAGTQTEEPSSASQSTFPSSVRTVATDIAYLSHRATQPITELRASTDQPLSPETVGAHASPASRSPVGSPLHTHDEVIRVALFTPSSAVSGKQPIQELNPQGDKVFPLEFFERERRKEQQNKLEQQGKQQ